MISKITLLAVSMTLLLPSVTFATGLHSCSETDKAAWLSQSALTEKLEAEGWSVRRMKEDGGCWEVYGTTPEGQRVEGYFHPVTGDPELIVQRGRVIFRAND
ncbi:PepSY domain-containing protein [uncultured Roseibium sp.]|uniref:PepSY domain-containing protein n=1 Tax=uncultured Roseibium sp. TaxID=1936171 RepID=UPI00262C7581|nr:PepSY domain-containing protein [uncultured Roseibium sp.]